MLLFKFKEEFCESMFALVNPITSPNRPRFMFQKYISYDKLLKWSKMVIPYNFYQSLSNKKRMKTKIKFDET